MSTLGPNKWFEAGDARFHPDNIIIDGRETNIILILDKKTGKIVWQLGPDYDRSPEDKAIGWIIGQHHAHMGITLYTAPDCIRCKIVKAFLAERGLAYDTIDFKADAQDFNTFYRTNRKAIYRNPEGVEFPLVADGQVIKQGSGEIIAYLLSGHGRNECHSA